ncbi:MAG TPA: glycerol-3-phosphate 1-O-acyltransferase PlsY [Bryobacteraceae bacterium]|jgi:glycerol-3-phosphate acyltransferase PlsY|nr:glycerol-3-phosphate 1-O-acyltransferase PlsY [Bryobacteraceae bacterium]
MHSSVLLITFTTLLAYLIGGLPFGYLFVRFTLGKDVRTMGSGNIGATNVHRSAGGKAGVIVLFLDIAKGFLGVLLASLVTHGNDLAISFAIVAVMLGHCYPVFLHFRGGKAVACYIGAFLFAAPLALFAVSALFVLIVALTRFISLGSILGAAAFPFFLWFIYKPSPALLCASIFAAILITYRHRGNIERLRTGTESIFSFKGGSAR